EDILVHAFEYFKRTDIRNVYPLWNNYTIDYLYQLIFPNKINEKKYKDKKITKKDKEEKNKKEKTTKKKNEETNKDKKEEEKKKKKKKKKKKNLILNDK